MKKRLEFDKTNQDEVGRLRGQSYRLRNAGFSHKEIQKKLGISPHDYVRLNHFDRGQKFIYFRQGTTPEQRRRAIFAAWLWRRITNYQGDSSGYSN